MLGLYFDKDSHTYYFEGEKTYCVSDVLKLVDVIAMEGIPQRNIDIAAERGTKVHQATEDYEYGEIDLLDDEWLQENSEIENYVVAYANFLKDYPTKPLHSEESFYSNTYNLAGTFDLVKYVDGKLAIIDKKTSKTISNLRSILQLNAYRIIWNDIHPETPIEALYILQLCETGEYRFIPIELNSKILNYLEIFYEIKGDVKI